MPSRWGGAAGSADFEARAWARERPDRLFREPGAFFTAGAFLATAGLREASAAASDVGFAVAAFAVGFLAAAFFVAGGFAAAVFLREPAAALPVATFVADFFVGTFLVAAFFAGAPFPAFFAEFATPALEDAFLPAEAALAPDLVAAGFFWAGFFGVAFREVFFAGLMPRLHGRFE